MNLIYQNGMITTINKLTKVTKKTATAIDHIITNKFLENTYCCFSNNQVRCFRSFSNSHFFSFNKLFLQKMMLSISIKEPLMMIKMKLFFKIYQYDWDTIKTHQDANEAYNNFISTFCTIYDTFFPMNKMKIKTKDLGSPIG